MNNTIRQLTKISFLVMAACFISLLTVTTALAIPVMPSSFYGTVKLNNSNVADGTVIQAFTGTQLIAQGYSQTYQGDSVYSLDVPGDNTDTAVIDGGKEGDTITFKIGGIQAVETGTWHSGTNVQLNISATTSNTPLPPQPTPTQLPTQTPIPTIRPTSIPPTLQPNANPTSGQTVAIPTATISVAVVSTTQLPSLTPQQSSTAGSNSITPQITSTTVARTNTQLVIILTIVALIVVAALIVIMITLILRTKRANKIN